MKVTPLSGHEAVSRTVRALGLDETATDLVSTEVLCASLRRAASFLCPATPRQLVDAVLEAMSPLDRSSSLSRDQVAEQLDRLVSMGDLIELPRQGDRRTRQLYLGPPSYVTKSPGQYVLLGVRPMGAPLVDESVDAEVQYETHSRSLELDPEVASAQLRAAELHEIRRDHWLQHPRQEAAAAVVAAMRQRLDRARASGQVEGLTIVDPATSVRYYRGRRRDPVAADSGDFVARRPQAYGADLWCLVRIEHGVPRALVGLPLDDPTVPGCDEAWCLQAAIDRVAGQPQLMRVRPVAGPRRSRILDLFGPVPGWAQRYLELLGMPVTRARGALISYRVPIPVIDQVLEFFTDMLWIRAWEEGGIA